INVQQVFYRSSFLRKRNNYSWFRSEDSGIPNIFFGRLQRLLRLFPTLSNTKATSTDFDATFCELSPRFFIWAKYLPQLLSFSRMLFPSMFGHFSFLYFLRTMSALHKQLILSLFLRFTRRRWLCESC
ncbi:hypothetical protein OAS97_09070, partial [Pseudomonadales bacterium]|nr:hypothetical protein [Pseudomonadales bacterium]